MKGTEDLISVVLLIVFSYGFGQEQIILNETYKGVVKEFPGVTNLTITTSNPPGLLYINETRLMTSQELDLEDNEELCRLKLITGTLEYQNNSHSSSYSFLISIQAVDEYKPKFHESEYNVSVLELSRAHTHLITFKGNVTTEATDKDCSEDIDFYKITDNNDFEIPSGSTQAGSVFTKRPLHYDHNQPVQLLTVYAVSTPGVSANTTLRVQIKDVDDQDPVFTNNSYTLEVQENAPNIEDKWLITTPPIEAYDMDFGINEAINYSLADPVPLDIIINTTDGRVKLNESLDRENVPSYVLTIQAYQADGNRATVTATLSVVVQDVNDNSPQFSETNYNISIAEQSPTGTRVLALTAVDKDEGINAKFNYTLVDNKRLFRVDPLTGIISVEDSTNLDRESDSSLIVTVTTTELMTAVPPCSISCTATVTVNLLDINDNYPEFEKPNGYSFSLPGGAMKGAHIGSVKAHDKDAGVNKEISYNILGSQGSSIFSIDAITGELSLETLPHLNEKYIEVIVEAADQGTPSLKSTVSVQVFISSQNGTVRISAPVAKEELEDDKQRIEGELSRIIKADVKIAQINRTYSPSGDSSALYISATNNSEPVSTNDLLTLVNDNYDEIHALWEKYKKVSPPDDNKLSDVSIALIVIAGVILLVGIICVGVMCLKHERYEKKIRLFERMYSDNPIYNNQDVKLHIEEETSDYSISGSLTTEQLAANGDYNTVTTCINPAYESDEETVAKSLEAFQGTPENDVQEAVLDFDDEEEAGEVTAWCEDHQGSDPVNSILTVVLQHDEKDLGLPDDDGQVVIGRSISVEGNEEKNNERDNDESNSRHVLRNDDTEKEDVLPTGERNTHLLPPPPPISPAFDNLELPSPPPSPPLPPPLLPTSNRSYDSEKQESDAVTQPSASSESADPHLAAPPESASETEDVPLSPTIPPVSLALPPTPPRSRKNLSDCDEDDDVDHPEEPEPDYAKKVRFSEAVADVKEEPAKVVATSSDAESEPDLEPQTECVDITPPNGVLEDPFNMDAEEITAL